MSAFVSKETCLFKSDRGGYTVARPDSLSRRLGPSPANGGSCMKYEAINFGKKFKLFHERWQPKVIAEMNDYQFKIVKLEGDFIWHDHKNTDETFIVLEGTLRIDFRDGAVHRTQALCRARGQTIAD